MFASFLFHLFFAAIPLAGVTGEFLQTRAFFDANNVKVGDPLILTIDFIGAADFTSLHPPALSKHISRTDWKLDDASAKTDTYQTARRLTYRVRPMREGVLYFPALDFTYLDSTGGTRTVTSNPIPVHAKKSSGVVVAGMAQQDETRLPSPPPLITTLNTTDPDLEFAWRKACAEPTTNAFAAFNFPAAKLNEARCAILAGDWRHALKLYSRLEWQIGQTPEIERGIIAALAVRYANPFAELPVWRQVGRPILRYAWLGRAAILFAALSILALLYLLLRRVLRALAALALICALSLPSQAQGFDPFKEMDEMIKQSHQRMQQAFGGGGFNISMNFGDEEPMPTTNLVMTIQPSKQDLQVGENFELIFSLEIPKNINMTGWSYEPLDKIPFLHIIGRASALTNGIPSNPSNVVKRFSVPLRLDAPFKDELRFASQASLLYRTERKMGNSSFVSTQMRTVQIPVVPLAIDVQPLPTANQPADFSGIVASNFQLTEKLDLLEVETNDVVSIYYRLRSDGYVPSSWTPPDVAYEDSRSADGQGIRWRRYLVADGIAVTPSFEVCWYDPEKKEYRRQTVGATPLGYHPTTP
jgi:hypothetical protein